MKNAAKTASSSRKCSSIVSVCSVRQSNIEDEEATRIEYAQMKQRCAGKLHKQATQRLEVDILEQLTDD